MPSDNAQFPTCLHEKGHQPENKRFKLGTHGPDRATRQARNKGVFHRRGSGKEKEGNQQPVSLLTACTGFNKTCQVPFLPHLKRIVLGYLF